MRCLGIVNQPAPKSLWHLISRITTETVKPKRKQVFDDIETVAVKAVRITSVTVIELGEIFPNNSLGIVLTTGIGYAPIRQTHEPFRMLASQWGIYSAMVDDEINHRS
jgi:hypothetical protein